MRSRSPEIEAVLAVLVGLPFWRSTRACDLQSLQFGPKIDRVDRRGGQVQVGEYALHVQCAFRFCKRDEVVLASRDRYQILDDGETWDRPGANLLDVRMAKLITDRCPAQVTAIQANSTGDLTIEFSTELVFEAWVDDSGRGEHWRFFSNGDDRRYFVFENGRLQHN